MHLSVHSRVNKKHKPAAYLRFAGLKYLTGLLFSNIINHLNHAISQHII